MKRNNSFYWIHQKIIVETNTLRIIKSRIFSLSVMTECSPGFVGLNCSTPCSENSYGKRCLSSCNCTNKTHYCHHVCGCLPKLVIVSNATMTYDSTSSVRVTSSFSADTCPSKGGLASTRPAEQASGNTLFMFVCAHTYLEKRLS